MRVMGVDPGTARLGYGILEQAGQVVRPLTFGVIETRPGPLGDRLATLFERLDQLLGEFEPGSAAVEQLFFGQNTRTAIMVGHARGVVLLALARHHVPIIEATPAEVKQAVSGYGRADKRQVQEMVTRLLGLPEIPRPDDAADALAVAWCALGQARFLEGHR